MEKPAIIPLQGDLIRCPDLQIEKNYTYDLSQVTGIDSVTLGKFMRHVGEVKLVKVPPKIFHIICVLGLDKIIDVEPLTT